MPSEYLFATNVFFLLKSGAITISDDIFTTISAKLHWWQKNAITGGTIKEILREKSRHCEIYKLYYMPMKIKGRCLKRESIWRSEPNLLRFFAPITIKTKSSLNASSLLHVPNLIHFKFCMFTLYIIKIISISFPAKVFSRWRTLLKHLRYVKNKQPKPKIRGRIFSSFSYGQIAKFEKKYIESLARQSSEKR